MESTRAMVKGRGSEGVAVVVVVSGGQWGMQDVVVVVVVWRVGVEEEETLGHKLEVRVVSGAWRRWERW